MSMCEDDSDNDADNDNSSVYSLGSDDNSSIHSFESEASKHLTSASNVHYFIRSEIMTLIKFIL